MSRQSDELAEIFILNETQFHLGFLPTEQSSPLTRSLETDFKTSPVAGIQTLQRVDRTMEFPAAHKDQGDAVSPVQYALTHCK